MEHKRSQWASNIGFILALREVLWDWEIYGNFRERWLPEAAGRFLICYALIVLFVGFPVMLAELSIGRSTQKNVVGAFRRLNRAGALPGASGS